MKKRLFLSLAVFIPLAMGYDAICQGAGAQAAERHWLHAGTPAVAALLRPLGPLPETNLMRLAISLPLHNPEGLASLLQRLYDPATSDYRHYLTPAEFTETFGPTVQEYQTLINFAKSSGLAVVAIHESRQLLDVQGKISDVERAFHVTLRTYQHPTEDRQFYAPDVKPWVDASLPILDVAGLSDYTLLRPALHHKLTGMHSGPAGGSAPIAGDFMGQDFRNAYAPGVTLQGSGQMVGLFEADGYYAADIANYEAYANLPSVPLENVLIDNFNGTPGILNGEVAVDIEMAIAMAPALAAVVVFECTNSVDGTNGSGTEVQYWLDTLDRMASSNQIKQFSSSWGYTTTSQAADPNTLFDAAFQRMAAQGQSFFQASGDGDAWVTPIWVPADSPYVTCVGGTSLTMTGPGVAYSAETVWNSGYGPPGWPITDNGYWGSGGGVSTVYSIPYWQQGVSMATNQGSTTNRNIPDVALTATNVFFTADNGASGSYFGTSCSAPLWAGFTALVNQQAANSNKPPVGFLNPAIYALGQGPNYSLCFHDITTGSNTSGGSPSDFYAVPGYDLCTGWGTPLGSNLINALAGTYQPSITIPPASQTNVVGSNAPFVVTATGAAPLAYQWQFDGTNIAGATLANLVVSNLIRAGAGSYSVVVTNQWGSLTSSAAILTVNPATPMVTWASPAPIIYGTVLTSTQLDATANVSGNYTYTPATGSVLNAGTNTLSVVFAPTDTADYTTATNTVSLVVSPASLTVTANNRTKGYGQTVNFAGTEFTTSGLVNGNSVTGVTLTSSGSSATVAVAGSPYAIVPSAAVGTGLTNYAITYANGNLTISPAALTITASAQSKSYGQTVIFGSGSTLFTGSGLQNGETIGTVTLAVSGNGGAPTAPVAGSPYTITPSAATGGTFTAGNYAITYASGTLTVSPAALTVTANNRTKSYGQTVIFGSGSTLFTGSGLQNGETIGAVTLAVSGNGGAPTAPVSGSPYTITPSAATGGTFTAGNYAITYASGTLTVSPAALTVTANNRTKSYGQTVIFGSGSTLFTSSGLQNGETIGTVTLAVNGNGGAPTALVSGSPYTITPSVATGGTFTPGNYAITYASGNLTVGQTALTITASAQNKTYGQTVIFGSGSTLFTSSGLQNGETIGTVTLAVGGNGGAPTAPVAGSPYTITPSAATGGTFIAANYTITYASGNLTVGQAALTITASAQGKTYGQTVTFGSGSTLFTGSGLQNGETIGTVTLAVSGNGGAPTAPVSGSPYTITPSAATGGTFTAGNYAITYASGNLTVGRAALTVSASAQNKTYGQSVIFGSGSTLFTSSGLQNGETIGTVTLAVNGNGGASTAPVSGSPYTITPSAATGGTFIAANYTIAYVNGTLTVGEATPIITWTNPAPINYGAALTSSQLDATANLPGSFAYTPTNESVLNAGTNALSVTFTPTDTVDYRSVTDTVSLVVSPAFLTVMAANTNRTYGQANPAFTGTVSGVTNSDNITVTYSTTAIISSPLGTYAIVPSLVDPSNRQTNYAVSVVDGTLTVSQATPIMTWTNPASTLYGSVLTSNQLDATANVPGNFTYTPTNGSVLNAGTNALSVTFTPTDTVDYRSVTDTVSLVVSPEPLTVTAASFNRQFGAANPVFTGTITGLTNGDNITATFSCSATAGSPAGTYPIVPSLVDPNNRQTNYGVSLVNGILVVGHPTEVFTWTNPAPITYGAPLTPVQLDATANVPGSYTYDPTNGAVLNTGTNTLSVIFTPTDSVNYSSVTDSVSLIVTPAPLTITGANTNRQYGQANPVLTGTLSGVTNGDNITVAYSCSATASSPVGTYSVAPGTAVGTSLTNYTITYANGMLTVNPAALTITADDRTKSYGQMANFTGTEFTTSGLLNGDTVTSVTLTSSGAVATATVAGSPYNITPSAAVGIGLTNYAIAYANGTLTVSPAALTVTANNRPKAYGQTVIFAGTEFTTSGLVNGDTVTSVTLVSSGAAAAATLAGSPYNIVPGAAVGTGLANYTITYANGALTVSAASLTLRANSRTKTYGQTVTFAGTEFTTSGLVSGDTVTSVTLVSSGAAAAATLAGSPYNIVPGGAVGTGLANYTITYTSGALTVSPASLTVIADNRIKTYGQTVTFFGTEFTTSGLLNSDAVNSVTLISSASAATATAAGSPYNVVPSAAVGTGLNNYTITYANGTLTVNPAALTVTADNRTKTYGQTVSFAGTEFTTGGLLNSDSVNSVNLSSSGAAAAATVGGSPYSIVLSAAVGAGLPNYAITYVNGTLTVNEATPIITWTNPAPIIYGAALNSGQLDATANVPGSFAYNPTNETVLNPGTYTLSAIFTPIDPVDYISVTDSVSLVVTPEPLTVTAASFNRQFGAANPVFTGTITGVTNGDNITATYSCSATASSPAGTYPIVPSLVDPNNRQTNYAVSLVNGILVVGHPTEVFTWTNPAPITYGAPLTSVQLDATANVPGSYVYNPTNGAVLNTGTNTLSVVFTPTDTTDYSNVTESVSLVVLPALLTVTADNRTKTFGQTVIFAGTEFTTSGLVNSDSVTSVALTSSGATATATVAGSPYPIVPSAAVGATLTNYTITYINGTLTVNEATPIITWTNPGPIIYGAALTSNQLDAVVNVPGTFAYTPTNGSVLNAGTNTLSIMFTPADPVDYSSVTDSVSLVVARALLTVAAASFNRQFGAANPVFTGTITGVTNGDNITATYSCSATASSPAGTYPIVPSLVDPNNRQTNYAVSLVNGILVVGHPTEVFTWTTPAPIIYGAPLTPVQLDATANVPGSYAYDPTNGAVLNTGTNTLSVVFTPTDSVNYSSVTESVSLVVLPAPLTVAGANTNRQYGQANPVLTGTLSGVTNGDNITATYSCSATANSSVGTYPIVPGTAVGSGLTNYTITYANGTLTVNPAALIITADNRTKTFGQTVTFAGTEFTTSGLVNSDTVTSVTLASSGMAATATVAGSPYPIVPIAAVGAGLTNYTITYVNGTLTVNESTLTIAWTNPAPIIYGAALTSNQLDAAVNVPGTFAYHPTNETVLNAGTNSLSLIFTPTDTVEYSSVTDTVSLVVSPAPLTVTAASFNRQFGAANPVFTGIITGLTNSDDITATYSCSATVSSPVGTYPIVPSLVDPQHRQTNYAVSLVNGILVVGHPTEIFTWTNPAPIAYGAALTSIQLDATANVPGSYVYEPTNGAVLNTGTNTLTVIFTPTDTTDYSNVTESVSLVVLPALLTVTGANTNRQYGQANPVLTGTLIGVTNGDNITATYSCGATASSPVGTYPIVPGTAVGSGLTNYSITYANGTLTVNPAALTVTADNRTKTFGQTVTFAGTEFTTSGLLNGDTVTSVTLASSGAAATATVAGSPYPIVPGAAVGAGLTNYTITYVNGALTVTAGLPVIQSAKLSGNFFTFTWSTTPNQSYQVQFTTNLSQRTWANLGSPIAATTTTAIMSTLITNSEMFIRIMLVPNTVTTTQPVIQSAKFFGNFFTFTWSTLATRRYQIQYTTSLSQRTWVNLGSPITASGSTATETASVTSSQSFYRIILLP